MRIIIILVVSRGDGNKKRFQRSTTIICNDSARLRNNTIWFTFRRLSCDMFLYGSKNDVNIICGLGQWEGGSDHSMVLEIHFKPWSKPSNVPLEY